MRRGREGRGQELLVRREEDDKKSSRNSFRMSGPVFLALVNPKSGGNMGTQLLNRFSEILNEDRIYNLSEEGGPKRALQEHRGTENLRIIGKVRFPGFAIDIFSAGTLIRLVRNSCQIVIHIGK